MKPALLLLLTIGLLGAPALCPAVITPAETAGRLLRAELPANVDLTSADCEQLAAAVGRVTLAHQPEAPVILRVALTRGLQGLRRSENRGNPKLLPCACARRVLSISVAAAPSQVSALFDVAVELYPGCEAELAGALRDYDRVAYDYKDHPGDKNVVDANDASGRGTDGPVPSFDPAHLGASSSDDPGTATQNRGDLSDQDIAGLDLDSGAVSGFGTGFGSGFPGAPGFVGSPPDGGLALPPTAVTAAVNG